VLLALDAKRKGGHRDQYAAFGANLSSEGWYGFHEGICHDGPKRAPRTASSLTRVNRSCCRDRTYGESAMQRNEEFLKSIVTLMGVYYRSLPGKVSHHRRVLVNGGDGVGNKTWTSSTPRVAHTLNGEEDGTGPEEE